MALRFNHVVLALAGVLLGGCLRPEPLVRLPLATPAATAETLLQGRVFRRDPSVQAFTVEQDIAAGATVSLIDTTTHATVGSTVTTADGRFIFNFGASFKPDPTRAYFLEAVKGIKGPNGQFNQPGAEAVRLRSILYYQSGWLSLTNDAPGDVNIHEGTSVVAAMLGLRFLADRTFNPAPASLIGCLMPKNDARWQDPSFPFKRSDYDKVYALVRSALNYDQDPLRYLAYNLYTGEYLKTGTVFALDGISIRSGRIGAAVTLTGSGFNTADPTKNVVRFNGTRVPPEDVHAYANGTRIDVTVPLGATSGAISLEIDGTVVAGERFEVIGGDGHDALDDEGRLLVVSQEFGTLSRVALDGTVTTLLEAGLPGPRALTYDRAAKKLYVACYDGGKIVRFDMATGTPTAPEDWVSVSHPSGLALGPDGALYVASHDEGVVSRFRLSDAAPVLPAFSGFDHPVGLAFEHLGRYLYIAEQGIESKVTRLAIADATRSTWAYVDTPWGVAVDSGGNVFVSANQGGVVLRIAPPTAASPAQRVSFHASIPSPTGLDLDEAGTLYVGDGNNARLLRVTPGGGVYPFAYGISTSNGFALDGDNHRYVALSKVNAILKVSADGKTSQPFAVGIANPYGLAYRLGYLFASHQDTGGITRFDALGRAVTYAQGIRAMSTGFDVAPDGTVWTNKYAFAGSTTKNLQRGYDEDTLWLRYTGVMRAPAFGTAQDVFALVNSPTSIAARGGILFLLTSDGRLARISPTGQANAYSLEVLDATLSAPRRVVLDKDGNLIVSDNGKVYRYSAASGFARSQLGNDLPGVYGVAANQADNTYYAATNPGDGLYKLVGGVWTPVSLSGGTLSNPNGIAVAADGTVLVAEGLDAKTGNVKTVLPDGTVTTLPKPSNTPYDIDALANGQIIVSQNTMASGVSGVILYNAARTSFVEKYAAGGYDPLPMGVDRNGDKVYTGNSSAEVRLNGGVIGEGPSRAGSEVLVHASGVYTASPSGLYKFGLNGSSDLQVRLSTRPRAFAAVGGAVYYSGNDRNLYQVDDPGTGKWSKLTTGSPFPDVPVAMDVRADGIMEFVSGNSPDLYRVSADKTSATRLSVGLRRPEF